jgi:cytochrome b subunit of formate dehydrogenase/mono/diheme cytochrome c family protein
MSESVKNFVRFQVAQRIEHLVLIISFTTLGLTGLPQKYSLSPISQAVINGMGGIEAVRVIHRIAAIIFILEAVYHLVVVGYKVFVLRKKASMLPGVKDGTDALQWLLYNLGLRKENPKMPRYNFTEKMEYWAMLWGLVLMAVTGIMLWNPLSTVRILPGQFIPAAKAAHGAEGVLAVLAIILWHFYNVHVKKWNWSMIRGTMSKEEMEEEHGQELEEIEKGPAYQEPVATVKKKRQSIYLPVAGLFTVVSAFVIFQFVTYEQTSITTLPEGERIAVIVRQTPTSLPTQPPTAIPEPTATGEAAASAPATWDNGIGKLFAKCAGCHGASAGLSVKSYADLLKGGKSGPGVKPGDAQLSVVVVTMQGSHPVTFSADELQRVIDWVNAGAPEN